ncbi:MAG: bifunctional pyr operon transcriptional regulator/uracil phosphoribosyltransferase PyrR [Firmicutes bacterium]|jgi:pyrimidine operon attenuation protein/uracil phosphoribosyltransferase|uniref:Bifunctional protein PyrR n=2 Tax=root TaxID=1 RepID=A0A523YQ35_UNCAE|nr:bifunctional pyr operon transcriptional regulator/uracil phosphoribosyltransferase PyrR [Bacillota bacterium]TET93625.1 MAG: bifunctional pyr operon transcriptional regulator/uracil phosphoribosyltransferase PyrR [Candidatus Aerophobetes bacterium]
MAKLMDKDEIRRSLLRLSHQILEKNREIEDLVVVGIHRRGVTLAERISKMIEEIKGKKLPTGTLDITLYRDDLTRIAYQPVVRNTNILFPIDDKKVVLVDDVLYTGRTVRAAIDALIDFGRPKKIELVVLIDRGHRELPIRADYVGKNIPTSPGEMVEVKVEELDGTDEVLILKRT